MAGVYALSPKSMEIYRKFPYLCHLNQSDNDMKKTPTILLLLGLLLLVGCNDPNPVTDTLHRAEALMNEHPDSAWAVLNTLSADEMG